MRLSGWIWVRDSPSGRRAAGRAGVGVKGALAGPGSPRPGPPALPSGREAFVHRGCCLSRCVRAAESAAAVVPGDSPVQFRRGGEREAWPEGGGWGAGPARALSAVRPTRGRDGRPPERPAGPSVRAAGAYWSAGRRGRGPGCSSRWPAPAPLPRRP